MGSDRQAVVIGRLSGGEFSMGVGWEYCLRSSGRFRFLATTAFELGDSYGVGGEKLVGTYFGYWEAGGYHGSEENATLHIWNLSTRQVAQATYSDPDPPCYPPFGSPGPLSAGPDFPGPIAGYLLTPTGIAAWRDDHCAEDIYSPVEDIEALDSSSGQVTTLDTASTYGVLANLQLYECEGGCMPDTAVVAWTDNGAWRYSTIG